MAESGLQAAVTKWLKQKGCYVLTVTVVPGVPVGCPDVVALFPGGGWCALEVKRDAKAKYRPLQEVTIAKLDDMYYSRRVDPSNWDEIKKELEEII